MTTSDEFLDTLEKWLDAKILWADESMSVSVAKWAKTVDKDKRREFLNEAYWFNGYVAALNDLRTKIVR